MNAEKNLLSLPDQSIGSERARVVGNGCRFTILRSMDSRTVLAKRDSLDSAKAIEATGVRPTDSNLVYLGPGASGHYLPQKDAPGV